MILKILIKLFALVQHYKNSFWIKNPHKAQERTFNYLIQKAKKRNLEEIITLIKFQIIRFCKKCSNKRL